MARTKVRVEGKVSKSDIDDVLKEAGIKKSSVDSEKMETIKIGCELLYLTKEDVIYMASPTTTYWAAQRRLSSRRLES